MYVKAAGSTVLIYPYSEADLRSDNPQTSFPPVLSEQLLANYGMYHVINQPQPEYDPATQYVETMNKPVLIDDVWVLQKVVVDMTPAQIQARDDRLKGDNKKQAEQLLDETDWTTIPDVSDPTVSEPYLANSAEFASYRNQIRKIAVNPPVVVEVWPVEPSEVWV